MAGEKNIFGGVARSCETMMQSSFASRFTIIPVDSTQISNPPPGLIVRFILAFRRLIIFTGQVIKCRPDAVLLYTSVGLSFVEKCLMAWICRILFCPALIFPRGGKLITQATGSKTRRIVARALLRGARVFLAQGQKWRDFAVNDMGFDRSMVHIIPNWTATERQLEIGLHRKYEQKKKRPKILFVGWLEEFKGVFELLKACQILSYKGIDFELTLAGRGHAEEEAIKYVKNNKLQGIVTFSGWVRGEKLDDLYASNDIFVLPSWEEGMPNSMIEAMAAGLAVIVTTVGMVTDFMKDGKHALLVPPCDVNSLEKAMYRIILDDKTRVKLAFNGYQLAKTQFSVEPAMEKLAHIIESTISR